MTLFCGGFNASNQLGIVKEKVTPYMMNVSLDGLKCISNGEDHTILVYEDGTVLALGDDEEFTIGTEKRTTYISPEKIDLSNISTEKVVFAHCGSFYSAYLTESGKMIVCSAYKKDEPILIEHSNPIIHVAGGGRAPCAIDSEGGILLFQNDPSEKYEYIKLEKQIYDITQTDAFVACVAVDGTVYGNGILNNGQPEFAQIETLKDKKVKRVVSAEIHCIFITLDNKAIIFSDIYNEEMDDIGFHEIEEINITQAATGGTHALFLTPEGDLYAYGYSADGALLLGKEQEADPPKKIPMPGKISWIDCGHLQSFVLVNREPFVHPGAAFFSIL
ncbi:hypothetical protein TRFO_32621 [Tritrichomonas foetus]|uniref:Uncharacterized protein n=1 Tax=Tritrichomonas foetus TaxID=1144522 RepID=A0A1J4JT22_9EUKA|nr:hypothetical protein TRFO_32621 [Tritrichomonas foetus]|eukprot:OHT00652.1 hypothetical protein TRFO_32621 [Tritrichomonas foetus]